MTDQAQTIFEEPTPVADQATITAENPILTGIVNEDGSPKYADIDTALKSIQPAQAHIEKLEAELAEVRSNQPSVDDLLKAVRQEEVVTATTNQPDIAEITRQTVMEIQQRDAAVANQRKVASQLQKIYGDKAEEEYLKKAQDLSLGPKTMNELSGRSPEAVLSWFDQVKTTTTIHSSSGEHPAVGFNKQEQEAPKSVMGFSTTEEVLNAWKAAAPAPT